jgi:hypothetical protein
LLDTGNTFSNTKIAKSFTIALDSLESGTSKVRSSKISSSNELDLLIDCIDIGYGESRVQFGSEEDKGSEIISNDKYIFSLSEQSAKDFQIISESFDYPYKIAEFTAVKTKDYCFKNAPQKIKSRYFNIPGIFFDNCTDQVSVCFNSYGCNISVEGLCNDADCETEFDYGFVRKNGESIPFSGSLLIPALVSDRNIYDCNVKRLLYRASTIASLLIDKSRVSSSRGCNSGLTDQLNLLKVKFNDYESYDFISDTKTIIELNELNDAEACGLW